MRATLLIVALTVVSAGCGGAPAPKPGPVAVRDKTSPPTIEPAEKGDKTPPETKVEEKKKEQPKEKSPKTNVDPVQKPPVIRPGDESVRKAMHDIGVAHQLFEDARNRAPGSADDLEKYLDKGSAASALLKDGAIVVIWSAARPDDPAKAVLAYEAAADKTGKRLVLTADYAPLVVTEAEFQKMPKVSPKTSKTPEKK